MAALRGVLDPKASPSALRGPPVLEQVFKMGRTGVGSTELTGRAQTRSTEQRRLRGRPGLETGAWRWLWLR